MSDRHLIDGSRAYSGWWAVARVRAFERDGGECQAAGEHAGVLSVHHIKPVRHGGSHAVSNLVTLCRRHHDEAEAAVAELVISLPDDGELRAKIAYIAMALEVSPIEWVRDALEAAYERDYAPMREMFEEAPPLDDGIRALYPAFGALLDLPEAS